MAKPHKFTLGDSPARRSRSLYADIVGDFLSQGADSMEVSLDGVKPATLRSQLRSALKSPEGQDVKLVQRGEATYLVRGQKNGQE